MGKGELVGEEFDSVGDSFALGLRKVTRTELVSRIFRTELALRTESVVKYIIDRYQEYGNM